ncbi:MAG: hypothetical protein U9Q69_00425 [Nanoarchaeota archaeon]|nr:hypothetical protein [Nanoarchaeota archaeon]
MKKKLNIGFHETMYGHYVNWESKLKKFDFSVTATAPLERLNPNHSHAMLTDLKGAVTLENLCHDEPMYNGFLLLDFFKQHKLIYEFEFDIGDKGHYFYSGSKDLSIKEPITSMTTLKGVLKRSFNSRHIKDYATISKFKLEDVPRFLYSFLQQMKMK